MWTAGNLILIFFPSRNARKQEIIKAYRKLASQWHPDNFQSEEEKKQAEKKFIDIAAAKEVLTDPGSDYIHVVVLFLFKIQDVTNTADLLYSCGGLKSR